MCSLSLPQSVSEQTFDHPVITCGSYRGQERAAETVWFGSAPDDVPSLPLGQLESAVFAACSGPDDGLAEASLTVCDRKPSLSGNGLKLSTASSCITSAEFWRRPSRKAFGSAISLYDVSPVTGRVSGDPIADCFGLVARANSAVLAVADGVNWGEKSRLAARAAVRAGLMHANSYAALPDALPDTRKTLSVLLEAFTAAHAAILRAQAGLTTLCMTLVLPLARQPQFAVCSVNLGDTLAYVWSKARGIREITVGSHDVWSARDMRDAGGALGPARDGAQPELHNLTCSLTVCDPGDLLFLATDGVTDNFDPVVQRIAVPEAPIDKSPASSLSSQPTEKPELRPAERHQYALKQMERVLLEHELATGEMPSARELCNCLLSCVRTVTQQKRDLLESPELHLRDGGGGGGSNADAATPAADTTANATKTATTSNGGGKRRIPPRGCLRRATGLAEQLNRLPGKLDHACLAAYEIGVYRGDQFEVYEDTAAFRLCSAMTAGCATSDSCASPTSDSGCGGSVGADRRLVAVAAAAAGVGVKRVNSCSFAPDSLSDIEFADSDSD